MQFNQSYLTYAVLGLAVIGLLIQLYRGYKQYNDSKTLLHRNASKKSSKGRPAKFEPWDKSGKWSIAAEIAAYVLSIYGFYLLSTGIYTFIKVSDYMGILSGVAQVLGGIATLILWRTLLLPVQCIVDNEIVDVVPDLVKRSKKQMKDVIKADAAAVRDVVDLGRDGVNEAGVNLTAGAGTGGRGYMHQSFVQGRDVGYGAAGVAGAVVAGGTAHAVAHGITHAGGANVATNAGGGSAVYSNGGNAGQWGQQIGSGGVNGGGGVGTGTGQIAGGQIGHGVHGVGGPITGGGIHSTGTHVGQAGGQMGGQAGTQAIGNVGTTGVASGATSGATGVAVGVASGIGSAAMGVAGIVAIGTTIAIVTGVTVSTTLPGAASPLGFLPPTTDNIVTAYPNSTIARGGGGGGGIGGSGGNGGGSGSAGRGGTSGLCACSDACVNALYDVATNLNPTNDQKYKCGQQILSTNQAFQCLSTIPQDIVQRGLSGEFDCQLMNQYYCSFPLYMQYFTCLGYTKSQQAATACCGSVN
ncbi:hypothetical protein HDU76_005919 [Blyttiomyces sp. JEL0837]|nr:hypothetical protein HDU76_005919 [Blyttiomyces sp. JEL0837]